MGFRERRIDFISAILDREQKVGVVELAEQLGVSTETIRRDLEELETRGQVRRVYGGAVRDRKSADLPFADRTRVKRREKTRIGRQAAQYVRDGMKIFIGTGTTVLEAAKAIRGRKNLTVVTNSVAVTNVLMMSSGVTVVLLGGRLKPEYQALYGHEAIEALHSHHFDLALVGGTSVDLARGLMDVGDDEAVLHRHALRQSSSTILLADTSKFGRVSQVVTAGLGEIHTVITDGKLSPQFESALADLGIDLQYA